VSVAGAWGKLHKLKVDAWGALWGAVLSKLSERVAAHRAVGYQNFKSTVPAHYDHNSPYGARA
jgi:hypothetical protein